MSKSQTQSNKFPFVKVIISCETPLWEETLPEYDDLITKTIEIVLGRCKLNRSSEVSVVLTDDQEMKKLNALHRNQDKPTNVLSFPSFDDLDEDHSIDAPHPILLGDLVFAYETILREAQEQEKPFANHLTHLVVHGTLHLLGFDHEGNEEAEEMEALEVEILEKLSIPNPYN